VGGGRAWAAEPGRAAAPGGAVPGYAVSYAGLPAAGMELVLEAAAGRPVVLTVVDASDGLPPLPGAALPPRPAATMPAPGLAFRDPTSVRTAVTL
jgi:hypothetical protein